MTSIPRTLVSLSIELQLALTRYMSGPETTCFSMALEQLPPMAPAGPVSANGRTTVDATTPRAPIRCRARRIGTTRVLIAASCGESRPLVPPSPTMS